MSEQYYFYYGIRKAINFKNSPKQEVITSSYSIGGTHTGGICNVCIKCRIKGFMAAFFFGSVISALIAITWVMTSANKRSDVLVFILAGTAAIVFGGFAFDRLKALRKHDYGEDGSKLLIKAEKEKFLLRGYDSFWTPGEFTRLKRR